MSAVTIKSRILNALGMFWDKLKTTYVTSTASNAGDNLALAASAGYDLQQQINGLIKFATIYDSRSVALVAGENTLNVTIPDDCDEIYGVFVRQAWPLQTWNNAWVTFVRNGIDTFGTITIYAGSAQNYDIIIDMIYKATE